MEYDLTEPLKAYNYYLKDAVHENAANYFDGLVQSNNIDIDANRFTNQQLAKGRKKIEDTKKALNGKKGLKAFIIVSFILCFVAALVFIIVLFSHFIWWFILIALGLIAGGVGLIFLMRKINKGTSTGKMWRYSRGKSRCARLTTAASRCATRCSSARFSP